MGDYHYWKLFRRMICAAMAIVFALGAYCVLPALATESTVQVAKTDSFLAGSKELVIANAAVPVVGSEPLPLVGDGVALIEPSAGVVGDDIVLPVSNEVFDLVFAVRRRIAVMSGGMLGLQRGLTVYLPVYELADLLRFPSSLDASSATVSGYLFSADNAYEVNARDGTYTVGGETAKIPEGDIINRVSDQGGDIYISLDLLNKLWPVQAEFSFKTLELDIRTPRKLPYELAAEREKRQKYFQDEAEEGALDLEHTPSGHRMLGPHVFNLAESLGWNSAEDEWSNAVTVVGKGDLLGTSANYTLNWRSNQEDRLDFNNARLKLTRRDYGDGEQLPFGLRLLQLGDVSSTTSPLIGQALNGRGVFFSTDGKERKRSFDKITIDGTSQPGWEVELYRGRELVDFGVVADNGEYRFEDVDLSYGGNRFRVVLYGPQGQIEERIEQHDVRGDRKAVGEFSVEGSVVETGQRLFNVKDREPVDQAASRYLRVDGGLAHWASGFATFTDLPTVEGSQKYLSAGASFNALDGVGQIEAYKQVGAGSALDARFARKIAGFNTNLQTTFLNNFESFDAGFDDRAKTFEGNVRASKGFDLGFAGLKFNASARHREYENRDDTRLATSQTFSFSGLSVAHSINGYWQDGDFSKTNGRFTANSRVYDKFTGSASLDYSAHPETYLDSARLLLRYRESDDVTASISVNQGINNAEETEIALRGSYDFGSFLGGAEVNWNRGDGVDFLLQANTTFGPENEHAPYQVGTDFSGYSNSLKVQVYEDLDGDGVFSRGDVPVKGARLRLNQRPSPPSNKYGFINVENAGSQGLLRLTMDKESVPSNPFLRPGKDGHSVYLRPGTTPFVNFPLYQTGTIDGRIYLRKGEPIKGLTVELLNDSGEVIKEDTTLYDGFYNFEYVKPGTYAVRLPASYKFNVPPKTVTVSSESLFAYGVDILLEQVPEESVADNESVVRDGGRVAQKLHAPVADGTLKPAPTTSDRPSYTAVRAVRVGEYPRKARLVLDLSAPSVYSISTEDDGQTINIDLESTAWDVSKNWNLGKSDIFNSVEPYALPDGSGTRLRLKAKSGTQIVYNSIIPAENGLPDRIYADFVSD